MLPCAGRFGKAGDVPRRSLPGCQVANRPAILLADGYRDPSRTPHVAHALSAACAPPTSQTGGRRSFRGRLHRLPHRLIERTTGTELMELNGGQALIKALENEGVEVMFGLPGGAILPVYDPIIDSPIRHILVRHEQGAGHMAEGYAMVTGRPGVAMVTSGP